MNTEAQQLCCILEVVERLLPQLKEAQTQSATPAIVANEIFLLEAICLLIAGAMLSEERQKPSLEKIKTVCEKWATSEISAEFAAAMQAERPSAVILPFPAKQR
jgi:hypothetical protein